MSHPVTLDDAAPLVGLKGKALYVYRQRYASFPAPVVTIGRYKLYDVATIREWLDNPRGPQLRNDRKQEPNT